VVADADFCDIGAVWDFDNFCGDERAGAVYLYFVLDKTVLEDILY